MDVTTALQCRNMAGLALVPRTKLLAVVSCYRNATISAQKFNCGGPPAAAAAAAQDHGHLKESALCSGKSGQDWRVRSSKNGPSSSHRGEDSATGLYATVEKASDIQDVKNAQRLGSSEAACDEGSSFLAVESALENDGGKSAEDYKLRAHIFSESAIFFLALQDRNSHGAVQ